MSCRGDWSLGRCRGVNQVHGAGIQPATTLSAKPTALVSQPRLDRFANPVRVCFGCDLRFGLAGARRRCFIGRVRAIPRLECTTGAAGMQKDKEPPEDDDLPKLTSVSSATEAPMLISACSPPGTPAAAEVATGGLGGPATDVEEPVEATASRALRRPRDAGPPTGLEPPVNDLAQTGTRRTGG